MYGAAKMKILNQLIVKCNTALRLLQDKPKSTPILILYKKFNTLPVHLLHRFFIIKIMHRFVYSRQDLPSSFSHIFTSNTEFHVHDTRYKHHFSMNNVIVNNSISYLGPSLWFNLRIKNCSSLSKFLLLYKTELYKLL